MKYAKKSLGQNFLIDLNIIKKITDLVDISDKNIFEIGPGKGALTREILNNHPKSLTLIEKDRVLANDLKIKYFNNKNIKIFNKDILKFNLEDKLTKNSIIFGNLPYNISSQILAKIIKFKKWPPKYISIIFMFQKELAERIIGKFGTPQYGRLSILSNYRLKIINKFNVSPNCFFPKPKIISTVLNFVPHEIKDYKINNIENLEKITNIFFSNKRKMINKNIKKIFKTVKIINSIKDLDLMSRPEDLKPEKYYEITKLFEKI
jgi:16S rRNA (adenine1518-N6/adenine1519-N6)-dimethyltransferase